MEVMIKAPKDINCGKKQWHARYTITGTDDAMLVRIQSRSRIDLVVAKISESTFSGEETNYYISSPNFGVAIPSIPSLEYTNWIIDQLLNCEMPAPDAVTVAQVLMDIGDE